MNYMQDSHEFQMSHLVHESKMAVCIEAEEMNLTKLLNPKIFIDGNKWCVLYGENIQDGVCGFGASPSLAVYDFNKSWKKELDK